MKNKYNSSDIARTLSVSERTARRYIDKHLSISGNTKYISKEFFDFIVFLEQNSGQATDTERTEADTEEFDRIEGFSEEEYQEFQKRLIEYPLLKKYIDKLEQDKEQYKKNYDDLISSHKELINVHSSTLKTIEQRNFIEAKEKKLDS